jgi:hypothetical protein
MDNSQPNYGQYVPPSQYANINSTPLIQQSVPAVAYNQVSPNPSEISNLQAALKSNSQFVSCPFCRYQAMTRVEKKCSFLSGFCSAVTFAVPWLIVQACRGKDLNCNDAEHYCTRCGNRLANYHSC